MHANEDTHTLFPHATSLPVSNPALFLLYGIYNSLWYISSMHAPQADVFMISFRFLGPSQWSQSKDKK
jgi:hypothetical protein